MLKRRADWEARLAALLEERKRAPKRWGHNDCAMLACDAVDAVTGVDVGYELRGYDTAMGAVRAMARWLEARGVAVPGWKQQPDALLGEVAARLAKVYGCAGVAPGLAQRGDVVLLDVGHAERRTQNAEKTTPEIPRCARNDREAGTTPEIPRSARNDSAGACTAAGRQVWTRALGVVGMHGLPVTACEHGAVEVPTERIVKAWRIGIKLRR